MLVTGTRPNTSLTHASLQLESRAYACKSSNTTRRTASRDMVRMDMGCIRAGNQPFPTAMRQAQARMGAAVLRLGPPSPAHGSRSTWARASAKQGPMEWYPGGGRARGGAPGGAGGKSPGGGEPGGGRVACSSPALLQLAPPRARPPRGDQSIELTRSSSLTAAASVLRSCCGASAPIVINGASRMSLCL